MKLKIIALCFAFIPLISYSQSTELLQKMNATYESMLNTITDLTSSFCDNAYHHANTVKINYYCGEFSKSIEDAKSACVRYNVSSMYEKFDGIANIINGLKKLTDNFSGHYGMPISESEWYYVLQMLTSYGGWTEKVILENYQYATVKEYISRDGFKMTIVMNLHPKNSNYSTDNMIRVNWWETDSAEIGNYIYVLPRDVKVMKYKDDEHTYYPPIDKITISK